jgi:hypothetical protein
MWPSCITIPAGSREEKNSFSREMDVVPHGHLYIEKSFIFNDSERRSPAPAAI